MMGIFSMKEKKPVDFLELEVEKIENRLGRKLDSEELERYQFIWRVLLDVQILPMAQSYRLHGFREGKATVKTAFVLWGRMALKNYRAEYSRHAASGDLKGAMRFEERRKILADITNAIAEV